MLEFSSYVAVATIVSGSLDVRRIRGQRGGVQVTRCAFVTSVTFRLSLGKVTGTAVATFGSTKGTGVIGWSCCGMATFAGVRSVTSGTRFAVNTGGNAVTTVGKMAIVRFWHLRCVTSRTLIFFMAERTICPSLTSPHASHHAMTTLKSGSMKIGFAIFIDFRVTNGTVRGTFFADFLLVAGGTILHLEPRMVGNIFILIDPFMTAQTFNVGAHMGVVGENHFFRQMAFAGPSKFSSQLIRR